MEHAHLDGGLEPALVEPNLQAALEPGEDVRVRALAAEAVLAVTPRRVVVADTRRVNLAIPAGQAEQSGVVVEEGMVVPPGTGEFDIEVGLGSGRAVAPRSRRSRS